MKKSSIFILALLLSLCSVPSQAQFVVSDPMNFAQGIVNSSNQIVQTSTTASNMINNFKEVQKVYSQGKEYYDKLKSVSNLVKDARKVQQTILMVGEISDLYVTNFQKMMQDENYSVEELGAIAFGYSKLLQEGSGLLKELKDVVNITNLSMTDKERMDLIESTYKSVKGYRDLTRYYTNKNIGVSYLRAKKKNDTDRVISLYGTPTEKYW